MNRAIERHLGFNAESRSQWEGFTSHRERVTQLLVTGAQPNRSRLCVLGAGNCNDLDLPVLLAAHGEVYLVDLDHEALAQGTERQGIAKHPSLHLLGGVDVTGRLEEVATWSAMTKIGPTALTALMEEPARRVAPGLPGPFDLVASTCLLSPLVGNAFHSVGEAHPQFMEMVQAIRTGHLRLLSQLATAGGTGLLITDVVSSDILPTLATRSDPELRELLTELARERNHFHGVNPEVLWSSFTDDPVLHALVAERESLAPWRWKLHARLYLVWAIRFRNASSLIG